VLGFRNALAAAGAAFFREFTKSKDKNDTDKHFMVEGASPEGAPH
jgi:hypothetical protein